MVRAASEHLCTYTPRRTARFRCELEFGCAESNRNKVHPTHHTRSLLLTQLTPQIDAVPYPNATINASASITNPVQHCTRACTCQCKCQWSNPILLACTCKGVPAGWQVIPGCKTLPGFNRA